MNACASCLIVRVEGPELKNLQLIGPLIWPFAHGEGPRTAPRLDEYVLGAQRQLQKGSGSRRSCVVNVRLPIG